MNVVIRTRVNLLDLTERVTNLEGFATSPCAIISADCPTGGISDGVGFGHRRHGHVDCQEHAHNNEDVGGCHCVR